MIGLIKGTARQLKTVSGLPLPIASYKSNSKLPIKAIGLPFSCTQSGSGDPAPDNIRPITGVSSVNVTRTGKNLFASLGTLNAYITGSGTITGNSDNRTVICAVKSSTKYTISFTRSVITSTDDWQVGEYTDMPDIDSTGNRLVGAIMSSGVTSATITTGATTNFLAIKIANIRKTNFDDTIATLQVELGETATDYHAYTGNTYTIDLDGTRYGGRIDIVDGEAVMTVTHGIVDLSNITWFSYDSGSKRWQATIASIYNYPSRSGNIVAEKYVADITVTAGDEYKMFTVGGAIYIYYTDSSTPPSGNLVYPLATPITVNLGSLSVPSLLGQNNLWQDAGNIDILKPMDRQLYYGR